MENNKIQFVACGLSYGNCARQIPYDMPSHDKMIVSDTIDKIIKFAKDEVMFESIEEEERFLMFLRACKNG